MSDLKRQEILEMYKDFRVTDVRDGMDWCGYHHYGSMHHSIRPLWRSLKTYVGFARTARYVPFEGPLPKVTGDEYTEWSNWYYGTVCTDKWADDIIAGDFIALDVCGIDVGLLGSNNTLNCVNKGAVGFVLNGGGVRDTDEVILQEIPVFTGFVSQGMDQARIRYVEKDIPVAIGGVAVYPEDLIIADGDGVLVVPQKLIYDVYKYAYKELAGDRIARRALYEAGGRELDETVEILGES